VVNGKAAVSDDDDTLLLKVVQSEDERQPRAEPEAVLQVTTPFEYVRPVEKVVVAAAYRRPPEPMPTSPVARLERRTAEEKVEEAEEMMPFVKPTVVEVETPYPVTVQGKT
jgi:hypothetical protein